MNGLLVWGIYLLGVMLTSVIFHWMFPVAPDDPDPQAGMFQGLLPMFWPIIWGGVIVVLPIVIFSALGARLVTGVRAIRARRARTASMPKLPPEYHDAVRRNDADEIRWQLKRHSEAIVEWEKQKR